MEVWVATLSWMGQLALAFLAGGSIFLLLCSSSAVCGAGWLARLERLLLPAWLIYFGTGAAALAMRAALIAGETAASGPLLDAELIKTYALGTHAGRIAALRVAVAAVMALPLGLLLWRRNRTEVRRFGLLCLLLLAGGVAALGPLAGHAAADETTHWLVPIHMAHLLALSAWFGGLPFWIAHVVDTRRGADVAALQQLRTTLSAFSRLATGCMLVISASGVALAWVYVDTAGDLLGTRYGAILCAKVLLLVGVLAIANRMRTHFLPALAAPDGRASLSWAVRWVGLELLLAAAIAGLGVLLGQTTPAIHDQPIWLLPRRLSVEATWPVAGTAWAVTAALLAAALAGAALAVTWRRLARPTRALLAAAALAGAGTALWKLSVTAYPDTYRRSTVPYLTVSIAQGMRRFPELCASCHGKGGLGDGPIAGDLPKPPADLSEPHTALHTAGDMFWWLTHGIPESGMPGFAIQLDKQARWDMINFLRAFSQGFQARVLDTSIVPGGPWLGAPNFYFEDAVGQLRELKDYRERSNVLLVFPPAGQRAFVRARRLAAAAAALRAERTEILLIAGEVPEVDGIGVIRHGAEEIRQAYELLSRTIANRGDRDRLGMQREHMEFLIDRYGYIRARWIPDESSASWAQPEHLLPELRALNLEPRILPPPDDHVH